MTHYVVRFQFTLFASLLTLGGCAAKFRAVDGARNQSGANVERTSDEDQLGEKAGEGQNEKFVHIQQTFDNGVSGNSEYKFMLNNSFFQQEIKLEDSLGDTSLRFQQTNRPMMTDMFKQGSSGTNHSENFTQVAGAGVLDILVVIDNSGSMDNEQATLATRLNPLLSYVNASDWRIGVVTTNTSDPCMRQVIKKSDANAATSYEYAIRAGTSGSNSERGIEAAEKGLTCPTNNWVRPNSTIAVLMVSDEDNCSNGSSYTGFNGCPAGYPYNPQHFLNFLTSTMNRKIGVDARFYGIFWVPGQNCYGGGYVANDYYSLVQSTGGTSGSICASDFSPVLQSISQNIAQILKSQFALQQTPDAGSVVVTVNGVTQPMSAYSVMGNVVTFMAPPAAGSAIKISYKTGSQMQIASFVLTEPPVAGSVQAQIGAMPVAATDFSVNAASKTVTFNPLPPPGSDIRVTYRVTNPPLLTDFIVGKNVVANTLKASVNGAAVTNYTYDATTGVARFSPAPVDNALILFEFTQNNGPKLIYGFTPMGNEIRDLTAYDKYTRDPVMVVYQDNKITVPSTAFQRGRELVIRYRSEESNTSEIMLPFDPLDGTLAVEEAPAGCSLGMGIVQEGRKITLNCQVPDNSPIRLSYKYQLLPLREYVLERVTDPERGTWEVKVNDVLLDPSAYRREGNKIIFDHDLDIGARVFVSFHRKNDP